MQGHIWITDVKLVQIKVKCHFSTALLPLRGSATAYERSGSAELTCGGVVCSCTPPWTPHPHLSSWDRGTVGVDWFDVLMHCLMTGSSKWRMPLWCLSIGGHEKRHLAPEPRVMADSGFKGSRRAGRWLHSCHIIHSAWPFIFLESVPLPRQPVWLKRSQPLRSWSTTLCNCTCNLFNARIPWGK